MMIYACMFCLGFFAAVYVVPFALIKKYTDVNYRGVAMGFANMMCIILGAPILQPLMGWIISWHHGSNTDSIFAYSANDCHPAIMLIIAFLILATGCAFCMFRAVGKLAK